MTAFTAADWSLIKNSEKSANGINPAVFYRLNKQNQLGQLSCANGHDLIVRLITQKRRSIRLKISDQGQAELRCPTGLQVQYIKNFLAQHTVWLIEQQSLVRQRLQRSLHQIPIYGEDYQLQISAPELISNRGNKRVHLSLDHNQKLCRLTVASHNAKSDSHNMLSVGTEQKIGLDPEYKKHLLDSLRSYVKPIFQQRVDHWWPKYQKMSGDFSTQKPILRVKQMKTRWGSLSQRGFINLNMALIHYPPSVLDMVVVHELSHCRYFNHSSDFYRLMTAIKPDWRNDEIYLKNPKYRYF